jgi:hypothetical protein
MTSDLKSDVSTEIESADPKPANWLKLGLITAGSALAGGIAVAWWYRKTLAKLHETGENPKNPDFRISPEGSDEDI